MELVLLAIFGVWLVVIVIHYDIRLTDKEDREEK